MIKAAACIFTLMAVGCMLWLLWMYQPWRKPGSTIQIGHVHFKAHDCEIWQRKTSIVTEPFATGLFVKTPDGKWQSFLLSFEDLYNPDFEIKEHGSKIFVYDDGELSGVLDTSLMQFHSRKNNCSYEGHILSGEPPGDWWQTLK